jgi:hypothetical protein
MSVLRLKTCASKCTLSWELLWKYLDQNIPKKQSFSQWKREETGFKYLRQFCDAVGLCFAGVSNMFRANGFNSDGEILEVLQPSIPKHQGLKNICKFCYHPRIVQYGMETKNLNYCNGAYQ